MAKIPEGEVANIQQQYEQFQPSVSVAPQPVAAQPAAPTTLVITQPTSHIPQNFRRPWTSGLGDCFDDCGICFCVTCCTPYYQCYKMADFGESCCAAWPCCLGPMGSVLMLRYRMRHQEQIQGSMMKDCAAAACCYPCMACQLYREEKRTRMMGMGAHMNMVGPAAMTGGHMNMVSPTVVTQTQVPTMANTPYQPPVAPPVTQAPYGDKMSKTD